jgi:hypothetical protein
MAVTTPSQFRLTPEELAGLDAIAREWGPVKAMTRTDVIREMIRRTKAEILAKKPRTLTTKRPQS